MAGGWLCAYDEISKRRMCASASIITDELSTTTRRINSYWERKTRKGIHNFAFHPSDVGMLLISHKYDGFVFDVVLIKSDVISQNIRRA